MIVKRLRIGLYGIEGVGKSTLLNAFTFYENAVKCVEGSAVIGELCPGGLETFKKSSTSSKLSFRKAAIKNLELMFLGLKSHLLVSGHFSFPIEGGYEIAWTECDAEFYDLIVYIRCQSSVQFNRILDDATRVKKRSKIELEEWAAYEENHLRKVCEMNGIPFSVIDNDQSLDLARQKVMSIISNGIIDYLCTEMAQQFDSVILCDCDGTLNREDVLDCSNDERISIDSISQIFRSSGGYSERAFFQVSEYVDREIPESSIRQMYENASSLSVHRDIRELMIRQRKASDALGKKMVIVLISCGFPDAWQTDDLVIDYVVGGASFNRFGCIVSDEIKGLMALRLRELGVYVKSIGNSTSDLGMLTNSNEAFFVFSSEIEAKYVKALTEIERLSFVDIEENVK